MFQTMLIDVLGRRKDNFDWRSFQRSLDLASISELCILHHNRKVGDAILMSLLVGALKRAQPDVRIFVAASADFVPYWSSHPGVTEVIVYDAGRRSSTFARFAKIVRVARRWRGRFDVLVSFQPFARLEHFALLRYLRPRVLIGFNKDVYRLFDYSLEEHRQGVDLAPIALKARSVMRVFGIEVDIDTMAPHLCFAPCEEARDLQSLGHPRVLVNAYGSGPEKRLAPTSVVRIVEEIRNACPMAVFHVSVPQGLVVDYNAALENAGLGEVRVVGPQPGLSSLCSLVAAADVVVSPDTGVGHIAAALRKPQICLFARQGSVPTVWRPLNERCSVLVPTLGNDVNGIEWGEFARAVRRTLSLAAETSEPLSSKAIR